MSAKRSHKKSKNGCYTCRSRKIKCDEVHPQCGPCKKHCVTCYYDRPNPASQNWQNRYWPARASSVVANAPPPWFGAPDKRKLELKLMNFFTYINSHRTIDPNLQRLWAFHIPQRATESQCLMNAVFSYAALHVHVHRPDDQEISHAAHHYFGDSIQLLSREVANVDHANADVVFATSVLVGFQTSISWLDPCGRLDRNYELPVQWLQMARGVRSVLQMAGPHIRASPMKILLETTPRGCKCSGTDTDLFLDRFIMDSPTGRVVCESDDADEAEALSGGLFLVQEVWNAIMAGEAADQTRRRLLVVPVRMRPRFIDMVTTHDPRALVIMAFFFAAMKKLEGYWWLNGRASYEVKGIFGLLPEEYKDHVSWPLSIVTEGELGDLSLLPEIPYLVSEKSPDNWLEEMDQPGIV